MAPVTAPGDPPAGGETAGIIAPAPAIYVLPLLLGILIDRWYPLPILPARAAAWIGAGCAALGLIAVAALRAFRRARTSALPWRPSTALVTDGPFRFTRNPIYLGFTLVYVGVSIAVNAAWPLLFLPVVIAVMSVGVIAREEAYLARVFGDAYRDYCARVRRWI